MTEQLTQVQLRYRPGPDVLTGQLHLPGGEAARRSQLTPDADTMFEWAHLPDGPHLASFRIIHAAARLSAGRLPLPTMLDHPVQRLLTSAQHAISGTTDPLERITTQASATVAVPLAGVHASQLAAAAPPGTPHTGPSHAGPSHAGPPGRAAPRTPDTAELALRIRQAADAVHTWAAAGDTNEATHNDELTSLLRELSSTIGSSHGLAAPGARAAAQRALERSRHLPDQHYQLLASGLHDLDDRSSWQRALEAFEAAAEQRGHHPAR